jgi:hypothetical protein
VEPENIDRIRANAALHQRGLESKRTPGGDSDRVCGSNSAISPAARASLWAARVFLNAIAKVLLATDIEY